MNRALLTALTLTLAMLVAPAARGDGLPVLGVDAGATGVLSPDGATRLVTLPAGRDSLLAAVDTDGGTVLRSRLVPGALTIPAVAYDGTAAGLSADGGTLVLIRPRPRFPRAETTFAVLDPKRLRLRGLVSLRGDFSFDALSPDGATLFLIEYLSPRDPSRYRVRAYDLAGRRLLPEPIVDPSEPGERMRGAPVTRATSPDGRWEYTLYDGHGGYPFIHALDTVEREAVCIDLDALRRYPSVYDLRLGVSADGGTLRVLAGERTRAIVDTGSFRVREPAPPSPRPDEAGLDVPWGLALAPAAGLVLAGAALSLRRRRRAG